jgi:hypothetical protein
MGGFLSLVKEMRKAFLPNANGKVEAIRTKKESSRRVLSS